jgi:hypothetical protein
MGFRVSKNSRRCRLSRAGLLRNGHTSTMKHSSISIVSGERLNVCDGAHRTFVMKESQTPLFASR